MWHGSISFRRTIIRDLVTRDKEIFSAFPLFVCFISAQEQRRHRLLRQQLKCFFQVAQYKCLLTLVFQMNLFLKRLKEDVCYLSACVCRFWNLTLFYQSIKPTRYRLRAYIYICALYWDLDIYVCYNAIHAVLMWRRSYVCGDSDKRYSSKSI